MASFYKHSYEPSGSVVSRVRWKEIRYAGVGRAAGYRGMLAQAPVDT